MEQWKLPELRQSVGYQLHRPGDNPFQQSTALTHVPTPTSAPNSSGQSGTNRNADASSLTSLDKLKNRLRLLRIMCKHQIIKSRLQARLDNQESKNRVLATRRDWLKQGEQLLASLKAMKDKIVAAEYQERQLETDVKALDSAILKYDMKGLLEEAKEQEEKKENEDENEEGEVDDGESEEEEVDATENSEQDSGEEEDSESNCPDDDMEDDY